MAAAAAAEEMAVEGPLPASAPARALAMVDRFQQLLPQYQRVCGWPLVMTLSGIGEERAQHKYKVSAELLQQVRAGGVVYSRPNLSGRAQ